MLENESQKPSQKTFRGDFYRILRLIKENTPFSFSRFSDGELIILKNLPLEIGADFVNLGGQILGGTWEEEDKKKFDPAIHGAFRDALMKALQFRKENYFVGLSCHCCVRRPDAQLMMDMRGGDDEYTTWANLFLNANYDLFIHQVVPEFRNKNVAIICNYRAKTKDLPFPIQAKFELADGEMMERMSLVEDIEDFIMRNSCEGWTFLFSASSLTNLCCHRLFEKFENNTYIDIGTTLHKYLGLTMNRDYLRGFWEGKGGAFASRICQWL